MNINYIKNIYEQKVRYRQLPLRMIHFSLTLNHDMGIKRAEDPFNIGIFFLPKASFIMSTFSDLNTHIQAFHTGVAVAPPPPSPCPRSPSPLLSLRPTN